MNAIESPNIQGLVRYGYRRLRSAAFLLLSFHQRRAFRSWLDELWPRVATAEQYDPEQVVNVAFTFGGLARLGLDQAALSVFPSEFQEGMAGNQHRSTALGDIVESAPEKWSWGKQHAPLHALLLLYAGDDRALGELLKAHEDQLANIADVTILPTSQLPPKEPGETLREHFGFRDGLSQPAVQGWQVGAKASSLIPAGEFVLGYPNAYGQLPDSPRVSNGGTLLLDNDFGRNGTFLVVRQLKQDVQAFWRFLLEARDHDADAAIQLAAQMVGRWPSGTPLVLEATKDRPMKKGDDDFGFAQLDPSGFNCPLGAHIRRANPRDALLENDAATSLQVVNRHRIIRRGRPYGEPLAPSLEPRDLIAKIDASSNDRGLYFLCLNTNIARQFEFIQHTWINNPAFVSSSAEQDPLLGDRAYGDQPPGFTVQAAPVRTRVSGLARFVQVLGGAYFFMPGVPALRYLAQRPGVDDVGDG